MLMTSRAFALTEISSTYFKI